MQLKNKTCIVTGGTKGIGLAITELFLAQGARVVATYAHDDNAAQHVTTALSLYTDSLRVIKSDITKQSDRIDLINQAQTQFGCIDVLVNNAGTLSRINFLDMSKDEFDRVLNTNLIAPYWLTQHVAQHMVRHEVQGSVVNIASIDAKVAAGGLSHYELSKAALLMFSKSLTRELCQYGIRTNTVLPGLTQTEINRDQWQHDGDVWENRSKPIPLGRAGMPEDVAQAALYFASDVSSYVSGAEIVVDGGLTTYVPQGNALNMES